MPTIKFRYRWESKLRRYISEKAFLNVSYNVFKNYYNFGGFEMKSTNKYVNFSTIFCWLLLNLMLLSLCRRRMHAFTVSSSKIKLMYSQHSS
jgi:hypothetical protein